MIIKLIGGVALGDNASEKVIAEIVKTDLTLLTNKSDLNFVNKLLIPLMNAEYALSVCLIPYDSYTER